MSKTSLTVSANRPMRETISAAKTIPLAFLPDLRQRIDKLNYRAEHLGCPAIMITPGTESVNAAGQKTIDVIISGTAPRLPGCTVRTWLLSCSKP